MRATNHLTALLSLAALGASARAQATQEAYIKASNAEANDRFGTAIAIDRDTLVVGAAREASLATGVNGDQSDNSAILVGAAYVFVRDTSGWHQQAYLKASNAEGFDAFGSSVAISGDTIVVAASGEDGGSSGVDGNQLDNSLTDSGAAYVFTRTGTVWSQQAYLKASNPDPDDRFGRPLAISGDTIAVSAFSEDSSHGGINGPPNNNNFERAGAVYVFVRTGTEWSQQAYIKAERPGEDDAFGWSIDLAGDTLLVAAYLERSNAVGVNGNQLNNSLPFAGAAYIFERTGTDWEQKAYLKAHNTESNDQFGYSVALSGDTVAIGANNEQSGSTGIDGDPNDNSGGNPGACYVFSRQGTTWAQEAYVKASGPRARFAWDVELESDLLLCGLLVGDTGAYALTEATQPTIRENSNWVQYEPFRPDFIEFDDLIIGNTVYAIAASGSTVVIGMQGEDSSATGINGDPINNDAEESGAVYVFTLGDYDGPVAFSLCHGDGGDQVGCTDCPCSNNAPQGTTGGCLNSAGTATRLEASGSRSLSLPEGDSVDLRFSIFEAPPLALCVLFSGNGTAPTNPMNPCFGSDSGVAVADRDGLRCAVQNLRRHGGRSANLTGTVEDPSGPSRVWGGPAAPPAGIGGQAGFVAGQTRYFQVTHRDDMTMSCMRGLNSSQALEVTFTP